MVLFLVQDRSVLALNLSLGYMKGLAWHVTCFFTRYLTDGAFLLTDHVSFLTYCLMYDLSLLTQDVTSSDVWCACFNQSSWEKHAKSVGKNRILSRMISAANLLVRNINQLDGACNNVDDRMMLLQQRSCDRVIGWREFGLFSWASSCRAKFAGIAGGRAATNSLHDACRRLKIVRNSFHDNVVPAP